MQVKHIIPFIYVQVNNNTATVWRDDKRVEFTFNSVSDFSIDRLQRIIELHNPSVSLRTETDYVGMIVVV